MVHHKDCPKNFRSMRDMKMTIETTGFPANPHKVLFHLIFDAFRGRRSQGLTKTQIQARIQRTYNCKLGPKFEQQLHKSLRRLVRSKRLEKSGYKYKVIRSPPRSRLWKLKNSLPTPCRCSGLPRKLGGRSNTGSLCPKRYRHSKNCTCCNRRRSPDRRDKRDKGLFAALVRKKRRDGSKERREGSKKRRKIRRSKSPRRGCGCGKRRPRSGGRGDRSPDRSGSRRRPPRRRPPSRRPPNSGGRRKPKPKPKPRPRPKPQPPSKPKPQTASIKRLKISQPVIIGNQIMTAFGNRSGCRSHRHAPRPRPGPGSRKRRPGGGGGGGGRRALRCVSTGRGRSPYRGTLKTKSTTKSTTRRVVSRSVQSVLTAAGLGRRGPSGESSLGMGTASLARLAVPIPTLDAKRRVFRAGRIPPAEAPDGEPFRGRSPSRRSSYPYRSSSVPAVASRSKSPSLAPSSRSAFPYLPSLKPIKPAIRLSAPQSPTRTGDLTPKSMNLPPIPTLDAKRRVFRVGRRRRSAGAPDGEPLRGRSPSRRSSHPHRSSSVPAVASRSRSPSLAPSSRSAFPYLPSLKPIKPAIRLSAPQSPTGTGELTPNSMNLPPIPTLDAKRRVFRVGHRRRSAGAPDGEPLRGRSPSRRSSHPHRSSSVTAVASRSRSQSLAPSSRSALPYLPSLKPIKPAIRLSAPQSPTGTGELTPRSLFKFLTQ
ncbi:hypothetical protein MPTK1_3g14400 [Marchantia polymorpha subsp. ruderalis]|uniref:H15 domain-containing protein n=2 Tax=Marchantia polymorpha TaxID=3197 RepID=A0AAF6B0Q6_MARPO|nr:hypothetical protein MARPO_0004s0231 [Marchantia polymorpha]BBN05590.1 hypothetical protein Mp_3g14400 [Marchantia polymorpha subsp. ruderalis]|eukprot:PTQ48992.1 hypothetical protein MARPO_0004s0231 [Marchantia polymorpha]